MINSNDEKLKLKLSTLDCNTSTKYYQLTQTLNEKQKHKIRSYFKYVTPEDFENLDNVAGKTSGWMCESENVEKVEELLGITETREKYNSLFNKAQVQPEDNLQNTLENIIINI